MTSLHLKSSGSCISAFRWSGLECLNSGNLAEFVIFVVAAESLVFEDAMVSALRPEWRERGAIPTGARWICLRSFL